MEAIKEMDNFKFLVNVPLQPRCDMCLQQDAELLQFAICAHCWILNCEKIHKCKLDNKANCPSRSSIQKLLNFIPLRQKLLYLKPNKLMHQLHKAVLQEHG
jgi:hypothetical protein